MKLYKDEQMLWMANIVGGLRRPQFTLLIWLAYLLEVPRAQSHTKHPYGRKYICVYMCMSVSQMQIRNSRD